MFERFTDRARHAIVVAQEEAKRLQHDFIQPEHLLLALTQGEGIAAHALRQLGVGVEEVRARIAETIKSSGPVGREKIPFSPAAKQALERSLREAISFGHNYIGTEHLVMGAVQVLKEGDVTALLGVDAKDVRSTVIALVPEGATADVPQSRAAFTAIRRARQLAAAGPMTTGHLLRAVLSDPASQAARAIEQLGATIESVEVLLEGISIDETSDAPPRPQIVEIKLGEATTTIGDPDLAAALGDLSPEELRKALRDAIDMARHRPEGGSEPEGGVEQSA